MCPLEKKLPKICSEIEELLKVEGFIAASKKMKDVLALVQKVAQVDSNILITGESGTGKEFIARLIHFYSRRKTGPFKIFNCSAFPENLIESELFGFEAGSFSGATKRHKGKFEQANNGTLFFDEIGAMPAVMQPKLLRVVQEKKVDRIGSECAVAVDVRFISATNADLKKLLETGAFREDLFYRLNVININIPPLRERREAIPVLVDFFIKKYNKKNGRNFKGITPKAMSIFLGYPWTGNVRELENAIEFAVAIAEGEVLSVAHLPEEFRSSARIVSCPSMLRPGQTGVSLVRDSALHNVIGFTEKALLFETLCKNKWNRRKTAEGLGIHRNTLLNKMKKYKLKGPKK